MPKAAFSAEASPYAPTGGMFIVRPKPVQFDSGEEFGFKLMSDLHIGAPNVDYDLIQEELEEAKRDGDRVFINGDVFDMILAQDRKRYRTGCIHPKIAHRADLVTAAVEWGAKLLAPYADIIDMIGIGNHEEAVVKHHSVDPVTLLLHELNKTKKKSDHVINYGGYSGFIDIRCRSKSKRPTPSQSGQANYSQRYVIYYHHGTGGAAPVTGGMIDFARTGWANADVIWFGHRHRRLTSAVQSVSCPLSGDEPVIKDVRHIQTGAYFDTYKGQSQASYKEHGRITNYAADMRAAPLGRGGARLVLSFPVLRQPLRVRVVQ